MEDVPHNPSLSRPLNPLPECGHGLGGGMQVPNAQLEVQESLIIRFWGFLDKPCFLQTPQTGKIIWLYRRLEQVEMCGFGPLNQRLQQFVTVPLTAHCWVNHNQHPCRMVVGVGLKTYHPNCSRSVVDHPHLITGRAADIVVPLRSRRLNSTTEF